MDDGTVVRELTDVVHRDDLKERELKHEENVKKRRANSQNIPSKRQRKETPKKKTKSKSKPSKRPSSTPEVIEVSELDAIEVARRRSVRHKSVETEEEKEPDVMSTLETGEWAFDPKLEGKLSIPVFDGPDSEGLTARTVAYAPNAFVRSQEINSPQENFRYQV
ncbi:unnamed protein product [Ambrosiozyma monospora]|uniref:Unnamed protein product n=1 Tax=Ambrosiozyma monospora TaxID=43982 RepID=A0ACB5THQ2_AMBMO|nr:unnamed protein product [Ambrosiozyma monospora]